MISVYFLKRLKEKSNLSFREKLLREFFSETLKSFNFELPQILQKDYKTWKEELKEALKAHNMEREIKPFFFEDFALLYPSEVLETWQLLEEKEKEKGNPVKSFFFTRFKNETFVALLTFENGKRAYAKGVRDERMVNFFKSVFSSAFHLKKNRPYTKELLISLANLYL